MNDFKLNMEGKFRCDKCGLVSTPEDFAYIGPKDRGSMECTPFMEVSQICHECENNNNQGEQNEPEEHQQTVQ